MSQMTPQTFAIAELGELGFAPTPNRVGILEAWEQAEGGAFNNDATANPLDTTLVYDGSAPMDGNAAGNNGHPVQAFRSWADGVYATAKTLLTTKNASGQAYAPILQGLADDDPAETAAAIVNSPWGTTKIVYGGKTYTRSGVTDTSGAAAASPSDPAGVQDAGLLGAHGWNPLNWPGQIASSAASGIWGEVQPFAVTAMFAIGAIAIFVLGTKQLVQPTLDKAGAAAKTGAETAGTAAML